MDPLARAFELAALGRGRTAPNPPVGAVLVRDGAIVGEGYHAAAGQPHAEVVALAQAGDAARGATLYVTLEPCCHHGRTPPCTAAIVAAGVAEVRYAIEDPDPRVAGAGRRALEQAGVLVRADQGQVTARELLRGYLSRQTRGRPWCTAKFAMSLDGKIAAHTGDARWISGEESRRYAHALRDRVDAVIVGVGTVLADDPRLTVRPMPRDGRQPRRIVVDSRLRTPLSSALVAPDLGAGTTIACVDDVPVDGQSARHARGQVAGRLAERGVELLPLPAGPDGRVDLRALSAALGRQGLNEVLVEGGGELLASFIAAGLVDELEFCLAPLVIGGRAAVSPVEGAGVERVALAPRFELIEQTRRGPDLWVRARPVRVAGGK